MSDKAGEQSAARTKLFVVEHSGGEWVDVEGNGGYGVFTERFEAQAALEAEADNGTNRREDYKIIQFVREASTAEQSPEPRPVICDCGHREISHSITPGGPTHGCYCCPCDIFRPKSECVVESPDKLNDECRDFFAESGSESPAPATTLVSCDYMATPHRELGGLGCKNPAERVAAPPEPTEREKFNEQLKQALGIPDDGRIWFGAGLLAAAAALQAKVRPLEQALWTAQTDLIELAGKLVRRELLPSLETCKTIRQARIHVQRFDQQHVAAGLKLKEIAEKLRLSGESRQ